MGIFSITNNNQFDYYVKKSLMTNTEEGFYKFLYEAFQAEYFIFPQVHLSALVSSKDSGKRSWSAFLHINGKSVDYVLCDRETLMPVCAIELDDWTHSWKSRVKRDREVERILSEAGMPLVRIKDPKNVNLEGFYDYLSRARAKRGIK